MATFPYVRWLRHVALSIVEPVSAYYRERAERIGVDGAEELLAGAALVLAPHPDDETLGCGVLILRKRDAGVPVTLVVATNGSRSHPEHVIARERLVQIRTTESLEAARLLGLSEDDVISLGHEDGGLQSSAGTLERELAEVITERAPEVILVTSERDSHPDHQTLARAARRAVTATGSSARLFEYPVWYWNRVPWRRRRATWRGLPALCWYLLYDPVVEWFRHPALRLSTGGYLPRKHAALAAHASQLHPIEGFAAPLPAPFVAHFFREYEVFFPVARK